MTRALQKCPGVGNRNRIQKGAHFPELLFTRYRLYWDSLKRHPRNTALCIDNQQENSHENYKRVPPLPLRMDINKKTTDRKTGRGQGEDERPQRCGEKWELAAGTLKTRKEGP